MISKVVGEALIEHVAGILGGEKPISKAVRIIDKLIVKNKGVKVNLLVIGIQSGGDPLKVDVAKVRPKKVVCRIDKGAWSCKKRQVIK